MQSHGRTVPLESLREEIAEGLWAQVSSGDLPGVCLRLGLADGTREEAHGSKRKYVRVRIAATTGPELLDLARAILQDFDIPGLADLVSEMTTHAEHRVSELTRRGVLRVLDSCGALFGDGDLWKGLDILAPNWEAASTIHDAFTATLRSDVQRHFVTNDDFSNGQVLELCGVLTCSQARFFKLLEQLVSPLTRGGADQEALARAVNVPLSADGFQLSVTGHMSRRPIYSVRRVAGGVGGAAKNLIFASINLKPDLVFTDAINNDVAIVNNSDALIYDRSLPESGLPWADLVQWWSERDKTADATAASRALYSRLRKSVLASGSPGEYALFSTYFGHFVPRLGIDLPALVPQVYLHFDPKSARQRGHDQVLPRQRMDLLLLLDHGVRVVLEVDGKHHYAEGDEASPGLYARMAAEDRKLRLQGYDVYRFGAAEFSDVTSTDRGWTVGPKSEQLAIAFFTRLFEKHPPAPRTHSA